MIVKHSCDQFRELVCDADILVEVCGRFDAVFVMEFTSDRRCWIMFRGIFP
jgi:hypothetical protein